MKLALILRFLLCSLVFLTGSVRAQDSSSIKGNIEFFNTMQKKMLNHGENLNTFFAASVSSEVDRSAAREMTLAAISENDLLTYVSELYFLYTVMENKNDKAAVRGGPKQRHQVCNKGIRHCDTANQSRDFAHPKPGNSF